MPSLKPRGSYAVMAQRIEPPDAIDFFETPPWATRALCEWLGSCPRILPGLGWRLNRMNVWEPACGDGAMVRPLQEYFCTVYASDVHDYAGEQDQCCDFLLDYDHPQGPAPDWIITNPPFVLACDFALMAIEQARLGTAILVRTAFLESIKRYERLFKPHPPTVLQFVERVPILKGRLSATATTATAYCWLVWSPGLRGGSIHWIPPCRKKLEREGDYELPIGKAKGVI